MDDGIAFAIKRGCNYHLCTQQKEKSYNKNSVEGNALNDVRNKRAYNAVNIYSTNKSLQSQNPKFAMNDLKKKSNFGRIF